MIDSRSLDGTWAFELDPDDRGIDEEWFTRELSDSVELPGTTDENQKGNKTETNNRNRLSRTVRYEGAAWYQRRISVPERWADRCVRLVLERTRSTEVWIDDTNIGSGESLSTRQRFDLTGALSSGEHRLTIRVDNDPDRIGPPGVMASHMATEHTQTNWNGIVGSIELQAAPHVGIDDLQVYPISPDEARVAVFLRNLRESTVRGELELSVTPGGDALSGSVVGRETVSIDRGETTLKTAFDLPDEDGWNEFAPQHPSLTVSLTEGGEDIVDQRTVPVPDRELAVDGTQFEVSGTTTFLRGTVDCCVFPRTGYAPTSRDAWREHLGTMAEYGLNHVRFHSWCPPAAAFEAADELGIYLQPELPLWNGESAFENESATEFYRREADRILDAYGNHPSFVMFALGNELSGDRDGMAEVVEHCRERDPRRLYAHGAFNFLGERGVGKNEDYYVTALHPEGEPPADFTDFEAMRPVRGSFGSYERGHVMVDPPSTTTDYAEVVKDIDVPVVSHEIGQYQVYPDYDEIEKYNGVLEPRNFQVADYHLTAHALRDRDESFQRDSGRFAVDCYREDMEAALRTPGFGGFQLLALQDFPGQGTALVGILDSFMDSKGLIDPEEWREFCSPIVPLARMERRCFYGDEAFEAEIQVAQYGPDDVDDALIRWELAGKTGTVASGVAGPVDLPQGSVVDIASIRTPLAKADAPAHLRLELRVDRDGAGAEGAIAETGYDVWAFPNVSPLASDEAPLVSTAYDPDTREALADGQDVLLLLDDANQSVPGGFTPSFWSDRFKGGAPPRTLGITCDEDHPIFDEFPTASNADWQWYHLLNESRPVRLQEAPETFDPIVSAIDNLHRNERLALVFETAVGDSGLLVCATRLDKRTDRPAPSGFLHSLVKYMQSDAFDPEASISEPVLAELLGNTHIGNSH